MKTVKLISGIIILFLHGIIMAQRQIPGFSPVMALPEILRECSGLVDLGDNIFIGLNDSGNKAALYLFTQDQKIPVRTIEIKGASNIDWEELAADDYYLYIGDMGNNTGQRMDLCIYKIARQDIFSGKPVNAEKINISYADQKRFKASNDHDFDCESMVSLGDSLYLFTKNRGNGQTNCYPCPKTPGSYSLKKSGSFDAGGLVTGAAYYEEGPASQLALIGYGFEDQGYQPFILHFTGFAGNQFFQGNPRKISFEGNLQTETILFADRNSVLVTNEAEHGDPGYIYRVYLQIP